MKEVKNCPYCNVSVEDENATFCGACGMAWDTGTETNAQEPVPEQTSKPEVKKVPIGEEAPSAQPDVGAPPQEVPTPAPEPIQPQEEEQSVIVERADAPVPAYAPGPQQVPQEQAQPPPPQYQQPGPQPQPMPVGQTYPPQQYPPPQPSVPKRRVGAGGMSGALVGTILALIGSFVLYYSQSSYSGYSEFIGVQNIWGDEFVYAWLILIFAILVIIFAPIAFGMQNRGMAITAAVFGLLVFLIAIILPIHVGVEIGSVDRGFFYSENGGTLIYIGGFMAIIGGLTAMSGAIGLSGRIKRAKIRQQRAQQFPTQYPPQQTQPQQPQYPQQQYQNPPQQYPPQTPP